MRATTLLTCGVVLVATSCALQGYDETADGDPPIGLDDDGGDGLEPPFGGGDGGPAGEGTPGDGGDHGSDDGAGDDGEGGDPGDVGVTWGVCPDGVTCADTFPFADAGNTAADGSSSLSSYNCAPGTNEGGPEIVYRVAVPSDGLLTAVVYDASGVDIDVHILSDLDASSCLSRGDREASAEVSGPALYWVVADSYVSGGVAKAGAYQLDIGFAAPSVGPCAMQSGSMSRVGDGGNSLAMPATGPIVKEAHLVTDAEPAPYPSSSTAELTAHYALSQSVSGYVMLRGERWAPLEGGSFYGAGIGSPTDFPTLHEAWYVNMYWRSSSRPAKGTRMILRLPGSSRAVVVAAGYETGPGNLSHVGGTTEETHHYLGTDHLDVMKLGIASDQALPFGPRRCTD
jgi:hypothetical protein